MKYFVWEFVGAVLLCFSTHCFAQSAPINDNFTNRIVLPSGSVTFTGTLDHATVEEGEWEGSLAYDPYVPVIEGRSSVWWSWTASASGLVTVDVPNFPRSNGKFGGVDAWTGTLGQEDFAHVGGCYMRGRHPFFSFSALAGNTYHFRAIANYGADFTLRVTETNLPVILVPPASRSVSVNGSTFFSVIAGGTPLNGPRLTYQWRFNGVDMPGETFPILSLDNLTTNQSGAYSVMVSNAAGGALSESAILNVTETNTPPQLMFVGCSNGLFNFKILGDIGRLYRVESSTNLVDWFEEKSFPREFLYPNPFVIQQRNGLVYNNADFFSVPQSEARKFYRTVNYVPSNEVCINNLAKLRCVKDLWAEEYQAPSTSLPTGVDLVPYLRNGLPHCPLDDAMEWFTSYLMEDISTNPHCTISFAHLLESPEY